MTLADLKVEGVDYQELLNIEVIEKAHEHASCQLTFIAKKDYDPKKILSWNKTVVTVKTDKDIIFCGIICQCRFETRIDAKILHVTAQSLSCQLEGERRSMTFQSAKKKLSEILDAVKKDCKGADLICWKDEAVAELIYRENLTDWEFLKKLAELRGQLLFVNSRLNKLQLSVGFKSFEDFAADDSMEFLRQSVPIDFYKRLESNTYSGARTCYFAETDLLTLEIKISVGCSVNYENAKQAVIASRLYVHENVLYNEIKLRHAEGCRAEAQAVCSHFDEFHYLTGKVLEAKDTNVKVQFDCDDKQDKSTALDIPYESPLSNYLYTMPDENDKVFVYVDRLRQAAMGSLRVKDVSDDADNRSFKTKNSAFLAYPEKLAFDAAEKTFLQEDDIVKFETPKDIIFSCKGDLIIQAAQGLMPDNQLTMAGPHMAGYAQYLAGLGQPATVQFNPAGSTVGKVDSQIKNAGSKKESVELSDLAKELDKLTGRKAKSEQENKSGGGAGGNLKLDGKNSAIVQVKDSSIEMKGSNLNVKTRALMQVAYIPMAGGGTGSLSKFEGGSPNNRSDKINVEHGREDRSRVKEKVAATPNTKDISR